MAMWRLTGVRCSRLPERATRFSRHDAKAPRQPGSGAAVLCLAVRASIFAIRVFSLPSVVVAGRAASWLQKGGEAGGAIWVTKDVTVRDQLRAVTELLHGTAADSVQRCCLARLGLPGWYAATIYTLLQTRGKKLFIHLLHFHLLLTSLFILRIFHPSTYIPTFSFCSQAIIHHACFRRLRFWRHLYAPQPSQKPSTLSSTPRWFAR